MPERIVDDRGAIMAEAVIVVPFLLIIWFGLDALVQLYAAKTRLLIAADAQAMAMAEGGDCGEADLSLADIPQTSGEEGALTSEQSSMIEEIAGCQPFAWAHANVSATETVVGLPSRIVAGGAEEVAARRSLMCNMKPVDGLLDLIAGFVSEALGLDD
jgi:hypothetical protein